MTTYDVNYLNARAIDQKEVCRFSSEESKSMRSTVAIFRKPISLRCGSFAASTSTSARLPQPISSPTPPPGGKTKLGANNARSPQHDEYAGRREIPGKDA